MLTIGQFDHIWEVEQESIRDRHNIDSDRLRFISPFIIYKCFAKFTWNIPQSNQVFQTKCFIEWYVY